MPNLSAYHPTIVHFVVALLAVGVSFRWISLSGRARFTGPAATTLLLLGTLAAILAVHSGIQAHGPAERVPGARAAVVEHEDAGIWARNIFLVVAVLEMAAVAAGRRQVNVARGALWGSALVGIVGLAALYKAGNRGGDLVYRYAGGVGTRYGDTADVNRLYVAAVYHSAQQARTLHDSARAAALFAELERSFPTDTTARLLAIESLIRDRNNGRAALRALAQLRIRLEDRRQRLRYGFLKADAYLAMNRPDSARATLEQLVRDFPDVPRIRERLRMINDQ